MSELKAPCWNCIYFGRTLCCSAPYCDMSVFNADDMNGTLPEQEVDKEMLAAIGSETCEEYENESDDPFYDRLIAAAPGMYALLKEFVKRQGDDSHVCKECHEEPCFPWCLIYKTRQLIKKIEGK